MHEDHGIIIVYDYGIRLILVFTNLYLRNLFIQLLYILN